MRFNMIRANIGIIGGVFLLVGLSLSPAVGQTVPGGRTLPALGLLVSSGLTGEVLIYDGHTGAPFGVFAAGGGLTSPRGFTFGPDGDLYVARSDDASVYRYDGITGVYESRFIAPGVGGLSRAFGVKFGLDGNLLVSDPIGDKVVRFNGTTGAFIDNFIPARSEGLDQPNMFLVHTDGMIYLASSVNGDAIFRYNGATGAFVDKFVGTRSGGIDDPQDLVFGPDGHLYVSSHRTNEVLRYDGATGTFLGVFVSAGSGGLQDPKGIAFGPDGHLYLASNITNEILRYDGQTGAYLNEFVSPRSGGLDGPIQIEFRSFDLPPSEPRVTILPENPTSLDNLFALTEGSIDPNLQPVEYSYAWLTEGMEIELEPGRPVSGPVLPRRLTYPGQTIQCLVTPTDGNNFGPPGLAEVVISDDPCVLSADLFSDGAVDSNDLLIFLLQWKREVCD